MSKFKIFCENLLKNSKADNYHEAVHEWEFNSKFQQDNRCICSQDIHNCYEVKNKYIKNKYLVIGNVCIKKFMKENKKLIDKVKIKDYNEKVKKENKLYKKCLNCGQKFKIKELKEHDWKNKCLKCYFLNKN